MNLLVPTGCFAPKQAIAGVQVARSPFFAFSAPLSLCGAKRAKRTRNTPRSARRRLPAPDFRWNYVQEGILGSLELRSVEEWLDWRLGVQKQYSPVHASGQT